MSDPLKKQRQEFWLRSDQVAFLREEAQLQNRSTATLVRLAIDRYWRYLVARETGHHE